MNIVNQETGEVTSLEIQSQELNELAKALCKAQAGMSSARMDGSNPHFRSSYATLDNIWQAARKPLTDNGLSVSQTLTPDNVLITTLLHESGQWLRSYFRLNPVKNDPQGVGSALTYGRRYSLAAIVGIAQSDEDDDGEAASKPAKNKQSESPKPSVVVGQSQPKTKLPPFSAEDEGTDNFPPVTATWNTPSNIPNSPKLVMEAIANVLGVDYYQGNASHLHNAVGIPYPKDKDLSGWADFYAVALAHAQLRIAEKANETPSA